MNKSYADFVRRIIFEIEVILDLSKQDRFDPLPIDWQEVGKRESKDVNGNLSLVAVGGEWSRVLARRLEYYSRGEPRAAILYREAVAEAMGTPLDAHLSQIWELHDEFWSVAISGDDLADSCGRLSRVIQEFEVRASVQGDKPKQADQPVDEFILTAPDIAILAVLSDERRAMFAHQICRSTFGAAMVKRYGVYLSQKVVEERVRILLEAKLVARPEGRKRRGVGITPLGLERLKSVRR